MSNYFVFPFTLLQIYCSLSNFSSLNLSHPLGVTLRDLADKKRGKFGWFSHSNETHGMANQNESRDPFAPLVVLFIAPLNFVWSNCIIYIWGWKSHLGWTHIKWFDPISERLLFFKTVSVCGRHCSFFLSYISSLSVLLFLYLCFDVQ